MLTRSKLILRPSEGEAVNWGGFGARFMAGPEATSGNFSIVEHPIAPKSIAAPYHTHANEDEYSFIIEGEAGFAVDEEIITGRAGDLVYKPRGIRHAFWNASDKPCRILEIISPSGFENYFREIAPMLNRPEGPDIAAAMELRRKYNLEMEIETLPELIQRFGLER